MVVMVGDGCPIGSGGPMIDQVVFPPPESPPKECSNFPSSPCAFYRIKVVSGKPIPPSCSFVCPGTG